MTDLILGSVIAAVDAVGRGQWDWWIVAVMVLVVAGVPQLSPAPKGRGTAHSKRWG